MQQLYESRRDTNNLITLYTFLLRKKLDSECTRTYGHILNSAADKLSAIKLAQKNYGEALYYLYKCDTLYPYRSDCGNDIYDHRIQYANRFADIFLATNRPDRATNALLKEAFNNEHRTHIKRLVPMLVSTYGKDRLKSDVNKAIANYKADGKGSILINLYGQTIWSWDFGEHTEKEILKRLKDSYFYKEVMAL